MLSLQRARTLSLAGLLAAGVAALPSFEWCPIAEWVESRCETAATCEPGAGHCAVAAPPACDREADPLPFGDRVWCVRPPVTALTVTAAGVPGPEPGQPLADLERTTVLAPVLALTREHFGPERGPPTLRAPHAPPRPRAPPGC